MKIERVYTLDEIKNIV